MTPNNTCIFSCVFSAPPYHHTKIEVVLQLLSCTVMEVGTMFAAKPGTLQIQGLYSHKRAAPLLYIYKAPMQSIP
jgi:hypothetical protein